MTIIGPHLQREADCEAVLRSMPAWFGIEDALLMYARDSAHMPTFATNQQGRITGFISLQQHFADAWEVHCIAVQADQRNTGQGLLPAGGASDAVAARNPVLQLVKALGPDKGPSFSR